MNTINDTNADLPDFAVKARMMARATAKGECLGCLHLVAHVQDYPICAHLCHPLHPTGSCKDYTPSVTKHKCKCPACLGSA